MPVFKGLLVDAAGTLLCPSEPAAEVRRGTRRMLAAGGAAAWAASHYCEPSVTHCLSRAAALLLQVYLRVAKKYGCDLSADEVLRRYRWAGGHVQTGCRTRLCGSALAAVSAAPCWQRALRCMQWAAL